MCEPTTIAVGAAIGAATSAATGNDPLVGALVGGATAGFSPGTFGATPGFDMLAGQGITIAGTGFTYSGLATASAYGLAGGVANNYLFPKQEPYNIQDYGYSPIQYNAQQNTITGSGGAQASALLASEIQRVQRTRRGEEITNTSALNTQPFQTTGLQLA